MICAVGDSIAHDLACFVAVVADAKHAGGDNRDVVFLASGLSRALADLLLCPVVNAKMEAGCQNYAARTPTCDLQPFRTSRRYVNRRRLIDCKADADFAGWESGWLSLHQPANQSYSFLELLHRQCF